MSESWKPHNYQIEALKFICQQPRCGIFLDPGMGKTSISLAGVTFFRAQKIVDRVLIVAPIRPMYKVWPDEIRKWDDFKHLKYTILHGDGKDQALNEVSDVYLINPEGLKWFMAVGGMAKIKANMLIIDESTKFKDSQTARFKLLKPHLRDFVRRLILTGEPAPNGYMDLFGQSYLIDQGEALGKFITHFRMRFFYQAGYGGYDYTLREGAAEEIQELLKPSVMRLAAEDHLEMPELIVQDILIDLPPEARKIYKEFEDDFLATIGDQTILTVNAAGKGSKCRQVANGGVYDENHISLQIHDAKTVAIYDLVEQLQGQPLLVAYEFQHDLARLQRVFPNAPCLTGMAGTTLDRTIDDFNAGRTPVLLAHPASAGHGLNLQGSCYHVCFYGITWDLDLYSQFYKRVWRQGQKSNRVFLYRIVADKTLDKRVIRVLREKGATQSEFLNALKENGS